MAEFLPKDEKGRIQIRIWIILIWLSGVVVILGVALALSMAGIGAPWGTGNDERRGEQLGFGAALLSFWIAALAGLALKIARKRADSR